jgi:cysteine desulfurase
MEIYLDNSATTPVCHEAATAAAAAFSETYGNPSALHSMGAAAAQIIKNARREVAAPMGVSPDEIWFSHSGTLANNTAVFGAAVARKKRGSRIVTTAAEHPSVARCMDALEAQGFEVIRLAPTAEGCFSPEALFQAVNDKTVLVSAMLVNNETGAVNPVEYLAPAVRRANAPALVHIDAIQGYGKLPFRPARIGADLVTVSGHKLHAPKGVGALWVRRGVHLANVVYGGGQENGLFSGTENVPGIAGFGAAARALPDPKETLRRMNGLQALLRERLSQWPQIAFNSPENGLPYILNFSAAGIPSQVLVNYLSARGICISAGSACKKGRRSEVLAAMGLPPARIDSAVRVSMSRYTTEQEISAFADAVADALREIRTKL